MVLVTEVGTTAVAPPVGDSVGLAVVTRGPLGLKLTAAMAGLTVPGAETGNTVLPWPG